MLIPILLWWFFAGHCTDLLWLSSVLAMAGASNLSLRWVNTSISTDIDRQYYNTALWFIKECMKIVKFFGRILLIGNNYRERSWRLYIACNIYSILERLYLFVSTFYNSFRELARRSDLGNVQCSNRSIFMWKWDEKRKKESAHCKWTIRFSFR